MLKNFGCDNIEPTPEYNENEDFNHESRKNSLLMMENSDFH